MHLNVECVQAQKDLKLARQGSSGTGFGITVARESFFSDGLMNINHTTA